MRLIQNVLQEVVFIIYLFIYFYVYLSIYFHQFTFFLNEIMNNLLFWKYWMNNLYTVKQNSRDK